MTEKCDIKNCGRETYLIYYGKNLCQMHWSKYADKPEKLKQLLGIPPRKTIRNVPPKPTCFF